MTEINTLFKKGQLTSVGSPSVYTLHGRFAMIVVIIGMLICHLYRSDCSYYCQFRCMHVYALQYKLEVIILAALVQYVSSVLGSGEDREK